MNCCDENGQCTQGAECPVRLNRVKPYPHVPKLPIEYAEPEPPRFGVAALGFLAFCVVAFAMSAGYVIGTIAATI